MPSINIRSDGSKWLEAINQEGQKGEYKLGDNLDEDSINRHIYQDLTNI